MNDDTIFIYTDGSGDANTGIGGWASILLVDDQRIVLSGAFHKTTHQRMELWAVLASIEYLAKNMLDTRSIVLYTDSQYVADMPRRKEKLKSKGFLTQKKLPIRNVELVMKLIENIEKMNLQLIKVKAHQPSSNKTPNHEVDRLARKQVRNGIAAMKDIQPDYFG